MRLEFYSYRYAQEILQHRKYRRAWTEIHGVLNGAPLFIYPNKSRSNARLDVVQQVMNAYFDRRLAVDLGWQFHPLATGIAGSNLKADYRKAFGDLTIQAEFQFGNMARWYSDIFKFQTAYSQKLINIGLSVVPLAELSRRIDSNVVNFERAVRELPSADLSITLPILLVGMAPDAATPIVDISQSGFPSIGEITGQGKTPNQWRLVHGVLQNTPISDISPASATGPMIDLRLLQEPDE